MSNSRLEAFSDGVIAIIITIMVLELKVPHGASQAALLPLLPKFLSYVLSFIDRRCLGIARAALRPGCLRTGGAAVARAGPAHRKSAAARLGERRNARRSLRIMRCLPFEGLRLALWRVATFVGTIHCCSMSN